MLLASIATVGMVGAVHLLVYLERLLGIAQRPVQIALILEPMPMLLTSLATLGWSRPYTFSSILSARSTIAQRPVQIALILENRADVVDIGSPRWDGRGRDTFSSILSARSSVAQRPV